MHRVLLLLLLVVPLTALLTAPSTAQAQLRLSVFDCGRLTFDDVAAFGLTNEETPVRELFVPCYLIQHADHLLVWDAGLPLAAVGQTGGNSRYDKSFLEQLAGMGISPGDIDFIAFSHMHYDHVGAANAFTDATLLIQQHEADAAFGSTEPGIAVQPELYAEVQDNPRITLTGDHDVFGDGSVRIISAPGHTPGHQVLYLELANLGPLVLSGDLYHFEFSRANRRTPVFNTDSAQTLESMDKVEAFVREANATFWIEHSLELAETLNLAPDFYD